MRVFTFPFRRRHGGDIRGRKTHSVLGLSTMWRGEDKIVWRKCASCSGGTQMLDTTSNVWGPIPFHRRLNQGDRTEFPDANTRNCTVCHGIGKHWIPESRLVFC